MSEILISVVWLLAVAAVIFYFEHRLRKVEEHIARISAVLAYASPELGRKIEKNATAVVLNDQWGDDTAPEAE